MATIFDNNIQSEEFSVILQRAYAAYGLSVVTERALPDARDGLKPVQRRILYGMLNRRYLSSRPTVKSAEIVGSILGDYHPHGDASVYDAMVRMAQDFTMRYPLIEGQGNFGSIDGDPPAAYRYTEARLSPLAEALMADIEKETVPLHPTYKQDPRVLEADYLPGRIPPVVNPSSGIAVGLSTNILPHNLTEVMRAAIALLDRPKMTVEQLMTYIKGPDFSGGGRVMGIDGIKDYLTTGKGRIIVRSEVRLEENPRTRQRSLIVVAIPPIGKDRVKASIVKAINDRKLEGLVPDVRDESDTEKGLRIVLELKKDAQPTQVLQQLYADTDLQIAITAQMVFLFGDAMEAARQPKQTGMLELLNFWNQHQQDVLRRRTQYDLNKAQERLHIVEGLIIGSANAQQIVKIFQEAATREEARAKIQSKYKLSERQVSVIADMTLSQVTRMDAGKYKAEKDELVERIAELKALLESPEKLVAQLKKEMNELVKRFGDARRTVIDAEGSAHGEVEEIASIVDRKELLVALTRDGGIKTVPVDTYSKSKKTASSATYALTRGDEQLAFAPVLSSTQDHLVFITDQGRAFGMPVNDVPEGTRAGKGENLKERLNLDKGEQIVALITVSDFGDPGYIVEFTRQGKIKKAPVSEYRTAGEEAIPDFKLADGDAVLTAFYLPAPAEEASAEPGDYLVTTDKGQTLRFSDGDVRAQQGRQGQGIQAISLQTGVEVVSASYAPAGSETKMSLLVVTASGQGKKTLLEQYPAKGRATVGVITIEMTKEDKVAGAVLVGPKGEAILVSTKGQSTGVNVAALQNVQRAQHGQSLLALEKAGDRLLNLFAL
ncbi:MAG TPA: DNA gyrase subunit A [Chloroflexia bacterium]|nr:DNA gyrase subunit A [Chloroflexia bacterium]